MALITRMARLFTADFHAVLDRIEEPELVLKQALRDMEEELIRNQQTLNQLQHEHETLAARAGESAIALQKLDQELDICFASEQPQLARSITRRKLQSERLANNIRWQQQTIERTLKERQQLRQDMQERWQSLRQKAELFCIQESAAAGTTEDPGARLSGEFAISDDEVEVAYLLEKQRRSRP